MRAPGSRCNARALAGTEGSAPPGVTVRHSEGTPDDGAIQATATAVAVTVAAVAAAGALLLAALAWALGGTATVLGYLGVVGLELAVQAHGAAAVSATHAGSDP